MPAALLVLCALLVLPLLHAADIEFVTSELPWATVDKAYSPPPLETRASGACPLGGIGYAVVSGSLPAGVQLSRLGYFSGVPRRTGAYEFAVRVSNGCTWTARHYVVTVAKSPVMTASPERMMLDALGDAVLHVSATWPRLAYQAASSARWLKVAPEHGFTSQEGSETYKDLVHVHADTSQLKPGHHAATIRIAAWQASRSVVVAVELTVKD
jgi:hypothetical protein